MTREFLVFLSLLFLSSCSHLFYYPNSHVYFDPKKEGHKAQDFFVAIDSAPKPIQIHARYFPNQKAPRAKALIVFFHGNAENLTSHFMNLSWLAKEYPYDFIIFDYRGYGQSSSVKPDPRGTVEDGKALLRHVQKHCVKVPLVVYGQSLGGAILLRALVDLADELQPDFVVIDSSFHSYQEVGRKALASAWLTWPLQWMTYLLVSDRYAPGDSISKIKVQEFLVIAGKKDPVVSYKFGEKIFSKISSSQKELWLFENGGHGNVCLGLEAPGNRKRFVEK